MIDWVIPGRLARSGRPGYDGGRHVTVDEPVVAAWCDAAHAAGVRSILCLLASEHLNLYDNLPGGLLGTYRARGFAVAHVPVVDHRWPPLDVDELAAVREAFQVLPAPVLVHCSAGVDRTGAAVAHLLAALERRGEARGIARATRRYPRPIHVRIGPRPRSIIRPGRRGVSFFPACGSGGSSMRWEWDGRAFEDCVVFYKVDEVLGNLPVGELSNMSGKFPLSIGGVRVRSTEALYQACRFPHEPGWQREILDAPNAMRAKMAAKKEGRRKLHSRPDWEEIQVDVMRWCLRVKLAQHYRDFFVRLLDWTGQRPIVERSSKDRSWGAVMETDGVLRGANQLGRLLSEVRDEARMVAHRGPWGGVAARRAAGDRGLQSARPPDRRGRRVLKPGRVEVAARARRPRSSPPPAGGRGLDRPVSVTSGRSGGDAFGTDG